MAQTAPCGVEDQFRYVSLSPDGRLLATGGWQDPAVRIWDAHTGALIKNLSLPEWLPQGAPFPLFEPNGASLIIGCWSNYCIWPTNSWTPGPRRARADLANMAVSHTGKLLAMPFGNTAIQLRDAASGDILATLQSPLPNHLTALAFSPDDTHLAVAHWGTRDLLVWDLRLLREDLKKMNVDWSAAPYQPAEPLAPRVLRVQLLTNSVALAARHK